MFARLLPILLMTLGLLAVVAGVAVQFGFGWALMAGGVGLVALAVNEAS